MKFIGKIDVNKKVISLLHQLLLVDYYNFKQTNKNKLIKLNQDLKWEVIRVGFLSKELSMLPRTIATSLR